MEQPQQNRTKLLVALGALVGLCVVSLLALVLVSGYVLRNGRDPGTAGGSGITRPGNSSTGQGSGDAGGPTGSKGENELVMLGAEPPTLDPALASDSTSANYIVELFSGLVALDRDLNVVPDIAEEWTISDDGTLYTFALRDDAKFADGKPVTAESFKYSIERACDPATQSVVADTYLGDIVGCRDKLRGEASAVSGVRAVDAGTLEIQIDAPKVYFIAKMTYPTAFAVDQATVEGEGRLWASKAPNGSGPFMLDEYAFGEQLVLVPNPNYYGDPKPSLERATFILSGGSSMTLYETDEVDVTGVGVADIDRVLDPASPLNEELREVESMSVSYMGLNANTPPFDDPLVRQAFNLALDKETIISVVGRGIATPAYGILPPKMPGFNPDLEGLKFDPERARELLAQSTYGGPEGLPDITLHVSGAGGTPTEEIEAMVQMWKENLGVTINIEQTEWATFLTDIARRPNPYQMFSLGWIGDYPDPQNFLDILFHCDSLDNKTGYCNEEVDTLLEQARVEQDQERRFELYQQAEQIIVNDSAWIPLWYGRGYLLVKPWVQDYVSAPSVIPYLKYVKINQ